MNGRRLSTCILLAGGVVAAAVAEPQLGHSVSEKGLHGWRLGDGALELEVIQRLPDQTRAFFEARGFRTGEVEEIAVACVMQAILRNVSDDVMLEVDLARWRRTAEDDAGPLRLRDDWKTLWQSSGAPPAARIAFNWALFPTRQRFAPGDYNWGMMSFALAPGSVFDLRVVWREDTVEHEAVMPGIRCAADD
jgi:hypothetical protein